MELTQEHFDKQISELSNRLDNMATKAELKSEITMALETQTKTLEDYTDQVATTIIEAIDSSINKINDRLDGHDKRSEMIENDVKLLKNALNLT